MIREKKTKSGPLLEIDFYPVFADGRRIPDKPPKAKRSTKEQEKYNQLQAEKKLIRYVNANFYIEDYLLHPTYNPEDAPQDEKAAKRDITNYLRRVKSKRVAELKKIKTEIKELEVAVRTLEKNEFLKIRLQLLKKQKKKLQEPFRYLRY